MSATHMTEHEAELVFEQNFEREAKRTFPNARVEGHTITVPTEGDDGEVEFTGPIDIPSDSDFDAEQVDYLPAPEIEAIATRLREDKPHFGEIRGYRIAFWWKRKGGQAGGKVVLGKCQKTPPLVNAARKSTWTIWLAADNLRDYQFTDEQVEALVFHELLHAGLKEVEVKDKVTGETDTEYRPTMIGHDFEFFAAEVREYGLWAMDLERARDLFQQPELPGFGEPVASGGVA